MLSQAIEDYLKFIYKLQHSGNPEQRVTTSVIAERLGVAAASATNMIKKLAEMHLLVTPPIRASNSLQPARRSPSKPSATTG